MDESRIGEVRRLLGAEPRDDETLIDVSAAEVLWLLNERDRLMRVGMTKADRTMACHWVAGDATLELEPFLHCCSALTVINESDAPITFELERVPGEPSRIALRVLVRVG